MWPWPWSRNKAVFPENRESWEVRRYRAPAVAGLMGFFGIVFIFTALHGMTDGFVKWPFRVWEMEPGPAIFITVFLLAWYGFALFWTWLAFRPLQTVRITGGEVQFCLGPLVFRRIPVTEIRTVIRTNVGNGWDRREPHGPPPSRLILSRVPVEELRERSMDLQTRRKRNRQDLRLGDHARVPDETVKAWVGSTFRENRLFLEWTPEAELLLRENLTTAVFLL